MVNGPATGEMVASIGKAVTRMDWRMDAGPAGMKMDRKKVKAYLRRAASTMVFIQSGIKKE